MQCIITEKQSINILKIKLTQYDETKKRAHDSQRVPQAYTIYVSEPLSVLNSRVILEVMMSTQPLSKLDLKI